MVHFGCYAKHACAFRAAACLHGRFVKSAAGRTLAGSARQAARAGSAACRLQSEARVRASPREPRPAAKMRQRTPALPLHTPGGTQPRPHSKRMIAP